MVTWTENDVRKLKSMAKHHSKQEIAEELGKTVGAVYTKARKLGIELTGRRKWAQEDDDNLSEYWGSMSIPRMASMLDRTQDAVINRAKILGLGKAAEQSEFLELKEFCRYSGITKDRIMNTLVPKYQFPLLIKHYSINKHNYFVDIDVVMQWMKDNQRLYDGSKVSDELFVYKPNWLRNKIRNNMLNKDGIDYSVGIRPWKEDDKNFIKINYTTMSDSELADRLNRTKNSVIGMRQRLGLYRDISKCVKEKRK